MNGLCRTSRALRLGGNRFPVRCFAARFVSGAIAALLAAMVFGQAAPGLAGEPADTQADQASAQSAQTQTPVGRPAVVRRSPTGTSQDFGDNTAPAVSLSSDTMKDVVGPNEHMVVEGQPTQFVKALRQSRRLNQFFEDERFEDEVNFTRIRLRGDAFFREGDAIEFDKGIRLRYSIPWARRRLVLLFSGDVNENDDEDNDAVQSELKSVLEPEEDEDAIVALQGFLAATERYNISIQAGGRFSGFNPVGFVGPRYRQTFDFDPWLMRINSRVRWYTDEGFDIRSVVDFERKFGEKFLLRLTPRASWSEEDERITYGFNIRLFHELGPRHVLQYEINSRADTEPTHELRRVTTRVRYRRELFSDWKFINNFFLEVAPELAFLSNRDFEVAPGILIRIDTVLDFRW